MKKKGTAPAAVLPRQIENIISQELNGETVRSVLGSDLTAAGTFGTEWLIIGDATVVTATIDGEGGRVLCRLRITDLRDAAIRTFVGKSLLQVLTDAGWRPLISFSDAKYAVFTEALKLIKACLAGGRGEAAAHNRPAPGAGKVCERCGDEVPAHRSRCLRCGHKGRIFLRIVDFSLPYAKLIALVFLFMILSTGFGLVTPYISKLFIDYIFKADAASGVFRHAAWLPAAAGGLFLAYSVQIFLGGVRERLSGSLGYKTVYDVRKSVFKRLQELSLSYFDKHQTGSLLSKVNQDTSELQLFIVDFFPITLESLILLVGVGAFLFALSWKLTLFILLPVAASAFFLKGIFPRIGIYFHRYFHRRSRLSALVSDSLSGIRVIKAFGREAEETQKFDRRSAVYRDAGVELTKQWSIYHPLLQFFIMTGGVLVWWIGGGYVLRQQMTVGTIIAYSGYLAMFYQPVLTLARLAEILTNSLSAAERVFDVIDTQPEIRDAPDAVHLSSLRGHIEFRDVSFGYGAGYPAVKSINFTVGACETVGLVGRSGSGKSTIISLLCRLYDPNLGSILIDGTDIRGIRHADLRRHIGVVMQETFLFNGTIYDNIAYARPEARKEQVIEAATLANAHEFIMAKSDGYDTEVGERGGRLSGGERQRIAIARAILRDPAILILDEATASVDTQTESKIQAALDLLKKNRTTIAIAHRLSTLRNFDRLLVLDGGELAEQGTHQELMRREGIFFKLVTLQNQLSHGDGVAREAA